MNLFQKSSLFFHSHLDQTIRMPFESILQVLISLKNNQKLIYMLLLFIFQDKHYIAIKSLLRDEKLIVSFQILHTLRIET